VPKSAVFFGTPEWAVPSLDALLGSDWDVSAVVTNPDRPAGRGYELHASPVKQRALAAGLEVQQPEKVRDPGFQDWLAAAAPDVAVVVAYGKILPAVLLEIPRLGFVNVHFSLLPAYRGAAPVQRAVMNGDTTSGISIMVLTEGMDEGPVLATRTTEIDPDETAGELGERLAVIGAEALVEALDGYGSGELTPVEQDHDAATYAAKIANDEAEIDWTAAAGSIHNKVRGLSPAPGAWTTFRNKRVKIYRTRIVEGPSLSPGGATLHSGRLVVGTGAGDLVLEEAQLAGKRRMGGADLANGLRPAGGERFG
jgi:methionyl-tRNA formyltransferase